MTEYSKEQLNQLNKDELIQLVLSRQTEMLQMDRNIQLILEQLADSKRHRFGRSTEKLEMDQQISFQEIDGTIVFFNEAEAIVDEEAAQDEKTAKTKVPRPRGKRERDLKDLPVEIIEHTMPEEQLVELFGENGWKRLPDEISRRYRFVPAEIKVEEHHIAVYSGKKDDKIIRADHPQPLLKGSLVSESLEAAILNAKYVNALPFYRQEREFECYGVHISRQDMANWTIQCAERYLAIMYDYLHSKLYTFSVLQADETTVFVNKDGRPAGSKSYMWLYRTVESVQKEQILLYEYQKTRNSNHPRTFLKSFHGICITDGYQVYHTLEQEREDLQIAGCWAHVRRRYDEALKALPKEKRNQSTAHRGLVMIQAIYRNEKPLKELSAEERRERRQLSVKPLVEAYFTWVHATIGQVMPKSKLWEGLNYSINQERYLKVFLENGNVPIDNNASERSIRSFCIGRKNFVMIDTLHGAAASAIIYSIAETAKANGLKPYEYFELLLTEIPKHLDDDDLNFCEKLLPWSKDLPEKCRKKQ